MTGDVAQDESREAYERLRRLLAPLGCRVHCVPGNHDDPGLMREVLDAPPFLYCASSEHGPWLVAGISTHVPGHVGGRIDPGELTRLLRSLDGSSAPHAVVCLHHPPVAIGSRWLDAIGCAGGEAFLEALSAQGKVRLVLFGHVHQAFEAAFDGMQVIATPSTCTQFLSRSDDYAISDEPPAYRRVMLYPDGRVQTRLVRVGGDAHAAA
jgi:Icc protein